MSRKITLKNRVKTTIFGVVFAILGIFGLFNAPALSTPVYAEPATSMSETVTDTTSNTTPDTTSDATKTTTNSTDTTSDKTTDSTENSTEETTSEDTTEEDVETCYDQVGAIGWLICPSTGVLGKAIDAIYSQIEKLLVVDPVAFDTDSPIYQVWQIMRDITNIVFVIFFLIIVYSQLTGLGITNYGIKKALPKLVVAAVLVNLSYLICAICVDASNIIGSSLRGLFSNIENSITFSGSLDGGVPVTWTGLTATLIGGGAIAGIGISFAGGLGAVLWPLLGALICAVLSVLVGLVTLGIRQALVSMLIMISPLAFVCYLLPNTESWFKKWKDIFSSMLIFYPLFSALFGAAELAGYAMMANAIKNSSIFGIILGLAVQVLPLFLAIPLMKMSSTVLGTVSSKLDNMLSKPKAGIRAATDQQRQLSKLRHVNNSMRPSAGLQRYLDKRNRKLELDIENETKIRRGNAEIWAQRSILGSQKYDPAYRNEYMTGKSKDGSKATHTIKTNASTRAAKRAKNIELATIAATKDTEHVLNNYGDYHKATSIDRKLDKAAGSNYLELYRANLVEENDAFNDEDFVMGQFNRWRDAYVRDQSTGDWVPKSNKDAYNYEHYIIGSAGALGRKGEWNVLGEVVSKSAANEAKRRAYANYAWSKWGYEKRSARDMIVGYYNDDDGFATFAPDPVTGVRKKAYWTDENGEKHYEKSPGEFLKYHPEALHPYDKYVVDANGKRQYYYDATDQNNTFVGRVYKSDTATMKELLSHWDMPIADPIDGLYGILSGVYEGDYAKYGLDSVGLASLSTTLNRATMSSGFKEKASFAGPMYATSIGQRYIKDMVHLNLERLNNLIKTAKPSGFNTQDQAELQQLKLLMDPENWGWMLLQEDSLRSYKNVNGERMKGTRYKLDENGNFIRNEKGELEWEEIDPVSATYDDLKNTVIRKFLAPAAPQFASMMSRVTNGIIDNQKPTAAKNWNGILDSMEKWNQPEWQEKYVGLVNPYAKQTNDTITKARQIRRRIAPNGNNGELVEPSSDLRSRKQTSEDHANGRIDKEEYGTIRKDNDTPYELTDEDRRADEEYEKEAKQAGWSAWSNAPEQSRNYMVRIDLLEAQYSDQPEEFINSAREYLDELYLQDSRVGTAIDMFEEYIRMNRDDATLSTKDFANELRDFITVTTFED